MNHPITVQEYLELPDAPAAFCFMPRSYYHKLALAKVGVQKNGLVFLTFANGMTLTQFARARVVWPVYKTAETVASKECRTFA